MEVINDLLNYDNLKIIQNTEMFAFSLDTVLLANFVTLNKSVKKILDIGCGNGPIPLMLSTKTNAHITGVEIQETVADMAKRSVYLNHLQDQIDIVNDDINHFAQIVESDTYDVITCNPPFFKTESKKHLNKNDYKTLARHEIALNLDQLLQISKKILKNGGMISIVHRSERLVDLIIKMRKNNIEPKRLQFIYPKSGSRSNIILIEGVKNGKPGMRILSPIYAHQSNGEYTKEILKLFQ